MTAEATDRGEGVPFEGWQRVGSCKERPSASSTSTSTMIWRERLEQAKKDHRPDLKDWAADGLCESFPAWRDALNSNPNEQFKSFVVAHDEPPQNYPIVLDAKHLTVADFHRNYEAKEFPCLIKNIPNGHDGTTNSTPWKALDKWQLQALQKDDNLLNRRFKCGEDDDGDNIRVKLAYFLEYLQNNRDDSPLYIFDSGFDDDKTAKCILEDYQVPSYFRQDLFGLVSERRRPPYRYERVNET